MIDERHFTKIEDVGGGRAVYEVDNTYSGMAALKLALEACYGPDSDWWVFLSRTASNEITRVEYPDPLMVFSYYHWTRRWDRNGRKYVAFDGDVPFAYKFESCGKFTRICPDGCGIDEIYVDVPGDFDTDGCPYLKYPWPCGTLSWFACSDDPFLRRYVAARGGGGDNWIAGGFGSVNSLNVDTTDAAVEWATVARRLSEDRVPAIRAALAHNRQTPGSLFTKLAHDPDWHVRMAVAWRAYMSEERLVPVMLRDPNDDVRIHMCSYWNDFLSDYRILAHDSNPVVRACYALACESDEALNVMVRDPDPNVQMYLLMNQNLGPSDWMILADRTAFDEVRAEAMMQAMTSEDMPREARGQ